MSKSLFYFLLLTFTFTTSIIGQTSTNYLDVKSSLGSMGTASVSVAGGTGLWVPARVEDKTITGTNRTFYI